jgi:hypothetical protein
MKNKNMKDFKAGYQAGYYDGCDIAYKKSLSTMRDVFLEIDTKWAHKAAYFCTTELDTLNRLEEERKELENK